MDIIKVVADDRECRSGIPASIDNLVNTKLSIQRLSLGDYLIDD